MKPRLQFSLRGLLLLIFAIAVTYPKWIDWYEYAVAQSIVVPTNYNSFSKLSPFTSVQFQNDLVRVRFEGKSYELLAINGVKTKRLLLISGIAFDEWRAEKRFAEDLPAVLNAAGLDGTKTTVELSLLDRDTGATIVVPDVPMTHKNRSLVYRSRDSAEFR